MQDIFCNDHPVHADGEREAGVGALELARTLVFAAEEILSTILYFNNGNNKGITIHVDIKLRYVLRLLFILRLAVLLLLGGDVVGLSYGGVSIGVL